MISRASVIFSSPLAFSRLLYFHILHIRATAHRRSTCRSDSGSGWVCPKPSWRRTSCNLPGAFPLRRRSRWYCLAAGVWLHSAASPPAAASPRGQIRAHSFHIYSKAPGPHPLPLLPSHMSCQRCHTATVCGDVGAALPPLIASRLGVSLLNWASLTFMFASISQVAQPRRGPRASTPQACLLLVATCAAQMAGLGRAPRKKNKMRAFPPGERGGQVSMLEIVQLARNVLWLMVFCSWAARQQVKVDRGGKRIRSIDLTQWL